MNRAAVVRNGEKWKLPRIFVHFKAHLHDCAPYKQQQDLLLTTHHVLSGGRPYYLWTSSQSHTVKVQWRGIWIGAGPESSRQWRLRDAFSGLFFLSSCPITSNSAGSALQFQMHTGVSSLGLRRRDSKTHSPLIILSSLRIHHCLFPSPLSGDISNAETG